MHCILLQILFLLNVIAVSYVMCNSGGRIEKLPEYNGPPLQMYSGYITVDKSHNRNIFYWLIEAENNPEEAPLIVWYQVSRELADIWKSTICLH